MEIGVDTLSKEELDELFSDSNNGTSQSPATEAESSPQRTDVEETKAFSKRLKERTDKAIAEERESIATKLGYKSYDDMIKQQENRRLEDLGYDPEQLAPIVEELVQKRLNEHPSMKELEGYRERQVQEFAERELAEVSKLTGINYTSLEQLPQDVLEDWRKSGSLKKSYMALHGEELILKSRSAMLKGNTSHLVPMGNGGVTPPTDNQKRHLTAEEKKLYKFFNPQMTEEELNNKLIDK